MIRTVWATLVVIGATVWWGSAAIFQSFRGRKDHAWYSHATRSWARAIMRASGCPVVVHGAEHVREGEPQVVVSNHVSWFDVFAIASVLHVPFRFVAKKELMSFPLFGRAMRAAGHVIIDRSNRERALQSLRQAGEAIRESPAAVIIFPEGTRSRTGRLQSFKKGAFQLAVEAGVPVVPTVVTGSFQIMPPGSRKIHPNTVHIHFLPAVRGDEVRALGLEPLMGRVHDAIGTKLGETVSLPPGGA